MSVEDISRELAHAEQEHHAAQSDIAAAQEQIGELQLLATIEGAQHVVDAIRAYTAQLRNLADNAAVPIDAASAHLSSAHGTYRHLHTDHDAIRQATEHTLSGIECLDTMKGGTFLRIKNTADTVERAVIGELSRQIAFLVINVGRGIEWGDYAIAQSQAAVAAAREYQDRLGLPATPQPELPAPE